LEITFQIGDGTYEKLRRAKDLLSHAIPDGDIGLIVDRALSSLLRDLERSKYGATDRPRGAQKPIPGSRNIRAWVRRAVWKRDGGRCAFVGPHGRCTEAAFLEFHHVVPFAAGGASTVENIELRCRAHNQREAEVYFGAAMPMARERAVPYGLGPDLVDRCMERGPNSNSPAELFEAVGFEDYTRECIPHVAVWRSSA
jgi:5-methylcytosine-specific restriction endonuclease McrA